MFDLRLPRRLALPLAATALALAPATASADGAPRTLTQVAQGHVLPSTSSTHTNMAFECAAAAVGDAAAVEITSCYLLGANGSVYSAPGGAQTAGRRSAHGWAASSWDATRTRTSSRP